MPRALLQPLDVLQHAPFVLELRVLVRHERGAFDFLALEAPQIEQAQLLLLVALQFLQFRRRRAPLLIETRRGIEQLAISGKHIQHVALRIGREQKLLIVLPVNISQERRQFFQQRNGHRPAADEGARFSAGQDLALDEQLAVFDFQPGGFQQAAHGGLVAHVEDARDSRAGLARADHFGRRAPAQQQAQGVHHDGFAAAGFAGQQIQPRVKMDAQPLHHRVVFNHQLEQHSLPIITSGHKQRGGGTPGTKTFWSVCASLC